MNEVKIGQPAVPAPGRTSSNRTDSVGANAVDGGKPLPESAEVQAGEVKATEISHEEINRAVAQMNEFVQSERRDLSFSVDEDAGVTVVRVTDSTSGELIRQIPHEVVLDLAASARKNEPVQLLSVYG